MLADRYASFDDGEGRAFEEGRLSLEELAAYGLKVGEPCQTSGKQELYDAIVNMYSSLTCIAEAWTDRYKNNTGIANRGDAGVVFVMVGK